MKHSLEKDCKHRLYDTTRNNYGYAVANPDAASAFVDLPMIGQTGRCYQRCSICGYTRYKPGYEMPDAPTVYQPEKIAGKPVTLLDLSEIPITGRVRQKRGKH